MLGFSRKRDIGGLFEIGRYRLHILIQDTDYRYILQNGELMDYKLYIPVLCMICTYIFHEHFFADHEAKHSTIRRRRKEEKEKWRKRAIEMNIPPKASMARILQAEENERWKRKERRRRETEWKKARERIEARKQAKKRRRKQALDDLVNNNLGMRYIANQIENLDKRYGGRYHAPPEVINEWLSQFKTEFGDSPCLDEKEVALRMKKQKEWEEFMQDDFLNRLKSNNR